MPAASPTYRSPVAGRRSPRWCWACPGAWNASSRRPSPRSIDAARARATGCGRRRSGEQRRTRRRARGRRRGARWSAAGRGRRGAGRRPRARRPRRSGTSSARSPTPPAWSRWMCVTTIVARSSGPIPSAASASTTVSAEVRGPGLDEARVLGEEGVGRGDPGVAGHPGVDGVHRAPRSTTSPWSEGPQPHRSPTRLHSASSSTACVVSLPRRRRLPRSS